MGAIGPIALHGDHELAWALPHPDFIGFTASKLTEVDANLGASDAAFAEGAAAYPNGEPLIAQYESHLNDAASKSPAVTQDTTAPVQQQVANTAPIRTSVKAKLGGIDYSTGQYINALNGNVQQPGSPAESAGGSVPTSNNPSCQHITPDEAKQIAKVAPNSPEAGCAPRS